MGDPIRVLHAVVNMNRGGAETLIMNLYRHIDRSRFQFDFLTCKEGVFDAEIRELGGSIHRIPYVNEAGHFGYLKALEQFFAAHRSYPIVHSHMDKMSGYVLRAAKRSGVPVRIAHSHNTSSEGGLAAKTYKWAAGKHIPSNATKLLACSVRAAVWLFKEQAKRSVIVKNGIDCDRFAFSQQIRDSVREELGISCDSFVVGHVGRFARQKNHSFLIDVFHELVQSRPDAVLLLAGDGPLRQELERKAGSLGIAGSVKFLGVRSDVHRLLQAMDVMVFPSFHEGLPVTLIEAQGSGLPCLVSEHITREADMGFGRMAFAGLRQPAKAWAEQALGMKLSDESRDCSEAIRRSGYDIRDSAARLQQFYSDQLKFVHTGVMSDETDADRVYSNL